MNLGTLIANEANVQPEEVMLLRHGNTQVRLLEQYGATIEEYTLIQPTDSKYDFWADGRPQINVVVVVVDDHVNIVYRILGFRDDGTTHTFGSDNFHQMDIAQGYPAYPARFFAAEPIASVSLGRPVSGWTAPRHPVARYGHQLFGSVEV